MPYIILVNIMFTTSISILILIFINIYSAEEVVASVDNPRTIEGQREQAVREAIIENQQDAVTTNKQSENKK